MTVLGLMSGSSLDGLDMALCEMSSNNYKLVDAKTIEFPDFLVHQLRHAPESKAIELQIIEQYFSNFCAEACVNFIKQTNHNVDLIGSHGHTIYHHPENGISLQIGSGAVISAKTGLPVISDFRQGDVSLGGQGAPFAAIVEKNLFGNYQAYVNLGGIANVSIHNDQRVIAYDIAPCNQVFNHFARQLGENYDNHGKMARAGTIHTDLIITLNQLPFFADLAPKSLGNKWVNQVFINTIEEYDISIKDKLASALDVIAYQISKLFFHEQLSKPSTIMISGGGSYNTFLIERLKANASKFDCTLVLPSKEIIDYKESILMAHMAYLRWNNKVNVLSSATGARRDNIGGAIYQV